MKYNKNYLFIMVSMLTALSILVILGSVTSCNNGMTEKRASNSSGVHSSGIRFGGQTFAKTSFAEIVASGTQASIFVQDDSSWNTYCTGGEDNYIPGLFLLKGVFLKGRKILLNPFELSQYEVTQELYEAVMGHNPSNFNTGDQKLRPVETVNWYDAVVFCNKLSLKLGLKPYYRIENKNIDWESIQYDEIPEENTSAKERAEWDKVSFDKTSNGFRLPTAVEWEFAARGGNAKVDAWKYAFAGTQCKTLNPERFYPHTKIDENLDQYGWYLGNSGQKTHAVGTKKPNQLGLYDMSGNVSEWCYDWAAALPITGEIEEDPYGGPRPTMSEPSRVDRGGAWRNEAFNCVVSRNDWYYPYRRANYLGIRLARSLK